MKGQSMKVIFGSAGDLGFKYRCGDSDYFALAGFVYSDDAEFYDSNFDTHPQRVVASVVHKRLINSRALRENPIRLLDLAIKRACDERGLHHAKLFFSYDLQPFLPGRSYRNFCDPCELAVFLASDTAADLISATKPFTSEINSMSEKNYITKVDWPLA